MTDAAKLEEIDRVVREVEDALANAVAEDAMPWFREKLRTLLLPEPKPDAVKVLAGKFDPEARMRGAFRELLEAAEECASNGYIVFMRPDADNVNGWQQQLYILPQSAGLAYPSAIHAAGGRIVFGEDRDGQ